MCINEYTNSSSGAKNSKLKINEVGVTENQTIINMT